ncbi:MAG: hypothetical protein ACI35P_04430 [Bacillus sp. (in: firmicutes)]
MGICPLCNGLQQASFPCKRCRSVLTDKGKITDFLDDYSAYEEIDCLKQVDGLPEGSSDCLHYFYCENCGWEEQIVISQV